MNVGWRTVPLGEVVTLQRGFDLPHRLRKPGRIPIVTSSGIEASHSEARVSGPGVVTGRYGTIGEVFFVEADFWPLNTTLYVRDFHGNDQRFISYLLRTIDFHTHSGKSGVPGVNRNDLHQLVVSLPCGLDEQKTIAEALSDADVLIESLERLIAKKRQIKQGAMQELLTGKRRLPGFSDEWGEKTFGELFDFYPTATNSRSDLGSSGDTSYVHYGDVHTRFHGHLDFSRSELPRIARERCKRAEPLRNGDWIMVDASEDFGGVAKAVEVSGLKPGVAAVAGLHTFLLREKTPTFAPGFKGHLRGLKALHDALLRVATGMKVFGVSKTALRDLSLPVPSTDEQRAIVAVLSDTDAEINVLEAKLSKARQIKQGMMQALLTGAIRLVQPDAGKPARTGLSLVTEPAHNQAFNEAVVLSVLTATFGSEQFPLGRFRRTKFLYLFHRHAEGHAEGYLKKAAGPYNPAVKYRGPEAIALKKGYVRNHSRDGASGFVTADNIREAEVYFAKWYDAEVLVWLDLFRYKKKEELELLTTVDMAIEDLRREGVEPSVKSVRQVIQSHPEWQAKPNRPLFSDANVRRAIGECGKLFPPPENAG